LSELVAVLEAKIKQKREKRKNTKKHTEKDKLIYSQCNIY